MDGDGDGDDDNDDDDDNDVQPWPDGRVNVHLWWHEFQYAWMNEESASKECAIDDEGGQLWYPKLY